MDPHSARLSYPCTHPESHHELTAVYVDVSAVNIRTSGLLS
jgi:hypothetical protein